MINNALPTILYSFIALLICSGCQSTAVQQRQAQINTCQNEFTRQNVGRVIAIYGQDIHISLNQQTVQADSTLWLVHQPTPENHYKNYEPRYDGFNNITRQTLVLHDTPQQSATEYTLAQLKVISTHAHYSIVNSHEIDAKAVIVGDKVITERYKNRTMENDDCVQMPLQHS